MTGGLNAKVGRLPEDKEKGWDLYFVGQYFLVPILLLLLLMAMIVFTPGPETETGPDILIVF